MGIPPSESSAMIVLAIMYIICEMLVVKHSTISCRYSGSTVTIARGGSVDAIFNVLTAACSAPIVFRELEMRVDFNPYPNSIFKVQADRS